LLFFFPHKKMGQYVRWQAILAFVGTVLLAVYLNSIVVVRTTVIVPAEGGVYREGVIGRAQYLNPLLAAYNPVDEDVTGLIFEGLTREDGLGNLKPALAENWSVSEDGRVYVFVLRRDVRWADGAPFTADDVTFTLRLIQSPDFPGNPAWQTLWQSVSIEPVDDYTLRFVLAEPFPSFPYYTTIGILPHHRLRGVPARDLLTHPFNLSPVGTGPFQLTEATDRHLLLERNPRYRGQPSRIERLEFRFFDNPEALYQAFEGGEIDAIGRADADALRRLQASPNARFFSAPLPRYDVVYLNLQQPDALPFFQEADVRRALWMLTDRAAMIDEALSGQAIPAEGPFLPWSWAFNPTQPYPNYDPSAAAELLDGAGWLDSDGDGIRDRDGRPFRFTLLVSNNPAHIRVAHALAQQWRKGGIEAAVKITTDSIIGPLTDHRFEAALLEVELFGDPDPYRFWHQSQIEGGQNFGGWDNTPASQALEQGRLALDRGERIRYYYEFQRIFAEELPALTLYHPVYTYVVRNNVKGVRLATIATPADRFRSIPDWYLLTRRVIETTANRSFSP